MHRIGLPIAFASLALLLLVISTQAQSETQPVTIHTACSGNCVADSNFIHSEMSDSSARETYHRWYSTYYNLTDCSQSAWQTDILFLLDVIGDAVGSPGGTTMQCWQGLVAQAANCSKSCSDYFISDARYAPNVEVTLVSAGPGSMEVLLDNESNIGNLPELEPNAYSRRFPLYSTLQRDNGTQLLFNSTEINSLSYPNWITRGGYEDCVTSYGADTDRCKLLEYFNIPSVYSLTISSFDGALYDLSDQVYNLSDANGSFSQDGYIRLLSDGDSITIKRGPYSGFAWVKTHDISNNSHSQYAFPWDASDHDVTIQNEECTAWFFCGGNRNETDTYVFATRGPAEKILPGTYTVVTTADIPHEKDLSNNTVSYSYESEEVGNYQTQTDESQNEQETIIPLSDLPIIDLTGPGEYTNSVSDAMPGIMYRLVIPENISFMFLQTVTLEGLGAELFTNQGSIPVPDFPTYNNGEYNHQDFSSLEWPGGLAITDPPPGEMYIFIAPLQDGANSYRLNLEWTLHDPNSNQTEDEPTLTEIEPNNSAQTANLWDISLPFAGQIARWDDKDFIRLDFAASGIYTYTLSDLGKDLKAKLTLVKKIHDNSSLTLEDANASVPGEEVSLTFDASAGETFYLKISAIGMSSDTNNQPYRLDLTGYIPDPYESNDEKKNATPWDLSTPIDGYFWDQASGNNDYYAITAPVTIEDSRVVFTVTNPSPDLHIRISLMSSNGNSLSHTQFTEKGQPATLSAALDAYQTYFLKLEARDDETSLQPYQLSASYAGSESTDGEGPLLPIESHPVRIHGRVYRQSGILQIPLREVEIYVQVDRQPALLLDTTRGFGTYNETVYLSQGQTLQIWAMKDGIAFDPTIETWMVDDKKTHQTNFNAVEDMELYDDGLATSEEEVTPTSQKTTNTPIPLENQESLNINGSVWRLFADSEPAGVGAAQLLLTVNGISQPVVYSMIDGTYSIQVTNLQIGDQLSLRAENPEDVFEPSSYDWVVEAGVENYVYDFFSLWGNDGSIQEAGQNHLYGRVTDSSGQGIAGLIIILKIGDADGLQLLGPTDANGFYEATVNLPSRTMITLWVEGSGYIPSHAQFFHAYASENQELNFSALPTTTQ